MSVQIEDAPEVSPYSGQAARAGWFQAPSKGIQISVRYGLPRTEGTVRSYSRPTVAIPFSTATGEPRLTYTLTGRAS